MRQTIRIDPVTRIEGHGQVFLELAEDGRLESAGLVVNELRGFERILVGVEAHRMPLLTARICGVCPAAHHMAAAKALDAAAGVEIPAPARRLRELLYMGHFIHSHALSLFVLQGPDLLLGLDADPATRNIVGLVEAAPDLARKALRCRTLGQKINELVGGRGTHPVTAVAGGITFRPQASQILTLREWTRECTGLVDELATVIDQALDRLLEIHPKIGSEWQVPAWSLGTVNGEDLDFYDGALRAVDPAGGHTMEFAAAGYDGFLRESVLPWSYMKPVRLCADGQEVLYRVGPLARINAAGRMRTPRAAERLADFRRRFGRPAHGTVLNACARTVELTYAAERAQELAEDPGLEGETRTPVRLRAGRFVGHVEAPRGTLIHDYEIDADGIVRAANLLVATQQNYGAINESIRQAAESHVLDRTDGALLNAVEFAIRCYDPCLSCATHAFGQMPLQIVVRRRGEVLRRLSRGIA
jgi:F420-non-reducing hydrogenase large subunit